MRKRKTNHITKLEHEPVQPLLELVARTLEMQVLRSFSAPDFQTCLTNLQCATRRAQNTPNGAKKGRKFVTCHGAPKKTQHQQQALKTRIDMQNPCTTRRHNGSVHLLGDVSC
jgi:hypothetical protein